MMITYNFTYDYRIFLMIKIFFSKIIYMPLTQLQFILSFSSSHHHQMKWPCSERYGGTATNWKLWMLLWTNNNINEFMIHYSISVSKYSSTNCNSRVSSNSNSNSNSSSNSSNNLILLLPLQLVVGLLINLSYIMMEE